MVKLILRCAISLSLSLSCEDEIMLFHRRLGDPSFLYLIHLFPLLFKSNDLFQFEDGQLAKYKHVSYLSHLCRASKPFALIHSNIWGPPLAKSLTNKHWFITFTDDYTQLCWVYLLKNKSKKEKKGP